MVPLDGVGLPCSMTGVLLRREETEADTPGEALVMMETDIRVTLLQTK